jgi:hypothetical protein
LRGGEADEAIHASGVAALDCFAALAMTILSKAYWYQAPSHRIFQPEKSVRPGPIPRRSQDIPALESRPVAGHPVAAVRRRVRQLQGISTEPQAWAVQLVNGP